MYFRLRSIAIFTYRQIMEELVEQTISNVNFNKELQQITEFYKCTFEYCDFQNAAMVDLIFTNCEFKSCNLSNIN